MAGNEAKYGDFARGDMQKTYPEYLQTMMNDREWGDNSSLQAFGDLKQVNIVVHRLNKPAAMDVKVPNATGTIHVAYHSNHYEAVVFKSDLKNTEKNNVKGNDDIESKATDEGTQEKEKA